jgi:isopentenyl-diphosphate Delta-isomerase
MIHRNEQKVVLVNELDEPIGEMDKMEVHRKGLLHRAFSIFIFDSKGNMLIQQRAADKYHGAFLWTNTCCSHPLPGEGPEEAAKRRLAEEMGFHTTLQEVFSFTYHAEVENDLIEHEFDHVFTGEYNGPVHPNPHEVAAYKYVSMKQLKQQLQQHPEHFTTWFRLAFPKIEAWWKQAYFRNADSDHS